MRVRSLAVTGATALVLSAAVAAPSIAQTTTVHRWLATAGVVAATPSFTELALVEHSHLYSTVDGAGHTKFSFTATNVAPADRAAKAYTWSVTLGPQGQPVRMAGGTFDLVSGASKIVPVRFTITNCGVRNLITVTLQGPDAREPSLHYWVLVRSSAEWKATGGPNCGT